MGQLTRNEVFTLAVQKYSDAVYRAAMHNSRCAADAEDVVQDVYEKLLHYNGTFESEEHLKAWLLRVAINRCRDLTRAAHQKDTELDENLPAPDAFEDGSVLDAVRALPENYRNAIYLHYYEGYTMKQIAFPVRVMKLLGVENYIVTNASGGINEDYRAGDLVLISDHIKFFDDSPLRGKNLDTFGVRFPDMSNAYDKGLRAILRETAKKDGIDLKEGVYIQFTGPSYESPADIRASRAMGADAVGMSTVVEVIAANHAGMRVCGVSCVANLAAGLSDRPLDGDEVIEAANAAAPKFKKLMWDSIAAMHAEEKA